MYVIYNTLTGEITKTVTGAVSVDPEFLYLNMEDNESVIMVEGDFDTSLHYVTVEEWRLALKKDYTLDSLPLPCTISIEGVAYEVTEQPTFMFDTPGAYAIEVDAGPHYLKKEFTIDHQP